MKIAFVILHYNAIEETNKCIQYIKDNIDVKPEITVEYFISDEKKSGGAYVTLNDRVRIIDEYERTIVFVSGKRINIADIYGILLSR